MATTNVVTKASMCRASSSDKSNNDSMWSRRRSAGSTAPLVIDEIEPEISTSTTMNVATAIQASHNGNNNRDVAEIIRDILRIPSTLSIVQAQRSLEEENEELSGNGADVSIAAGDGERNTTTTAASAAATAASSDALSVEPKKKDDTEESLVTEKKKLLAQVTRNRPDQIVDLLIHLCHKKVHESQQDKRKSLCIPLVVAEVIKAYPSHLDIQMQGIRALGALLSRKHNSGSLAVEKSMSMAMTAILNSMRRHKHNSMVLFYGCLSLRGIIQNCPSSIPLASHIPRDVLRDIPTQVITILKLHRGKLGLQKFACLLLRDLSVQESDCNTWVTSYLKRKPLSVRLLLDAVKTNRQDQAFTLSMAKLVTVLRDNGRDCHAVSCSTS
jgi:hypothetical protein